jgi:hypothetical protein
VPFHVLGVISRHGSPKGHFPSIRFLVQRGYFWASALRIDFCTRGVRFRCVVRRAPSGYECLNLRDGGTCGNLFRAEVEPDTTLVENPYSGQMRSDGKTRKITAIKLLNSIGARHIGARAESRCSARLERGLPDRRTPQNAEHSRSQ